MATGVIANYGGSMIVGALGSMVAGTAGRAVAGEDTSWSNVGSDASGGAFGGMLNAFPGSGTTSGESSYSGGLESLLGSGQSMLGSSGSSGGLLGSIGSSGSSLGMLSQFGQSVFSSSEQLGDIQYNSQMAELRNYRLMQQGVNGRAASYKEAEIINREAEIRLAVMRRELYRRSHSLGAYRGVRLDSGSIVDMHEDLIKQANYDMEIVKYQAEVDSGRYIDQGDMSVWTSSSASILNSNEYNREYEEADAEANQSIMNAGITLADSYMKSGSLLNSA